MQTVQENKYLNRIITIPNLLSFFRICLIPVIVWLYLKKEAYLTAAIVLVLSGVTDVVDGYIARHFGMISNFGKAFDPIADKLTQAAVLFCLIARFPLMLCPLVMLVIKEILSGSIALLAVRKTHKVPSAVWHGKATTVSLYAMMLIHLVWYEIPAAVSKALVVICAAVMLLSAVLYIRMYLAALRSEPKEG